MKPTRENGTMYFTGEVANLASEYVQLMEALDVLAERTFVLIQKQFFTPADEDPIIFKVQISIRFQR